MQRVIYFKIQPLKNFGTTDHVNLSCLIAREFDSCLATDGRPYLVIHTALAEDAFPCFPPSYSKKISIPGVSVYNIHDSVDFFAP